MKGLEFWAKEHVKQWPEGREREVAYTAYIDGFRAARKRAVEFLERFGNPMLKNTALLLGAMGQGDCDENGKPDSDRE